MSLCTVPKLLQLLTTLGPHLVIVLEHVDLRLITLSRLTGCMVLGCLLQDLQDCQQKLGLKK